VATKAVFRKFWKFWSLSVNQKTIAKILEIFAKPLETTKLTKKKKKACQGNYPNPT
jgi:hypothetical protein